MSQISQATPAKWLRRAAIVAITLVPLAFAGLFVGALSQSTSAVDHIPAAIVNSDKLVYQTAADGTKTPVFAGRQIVTELTGGSAGFDWKVTNAADAAQSLADGDIDAVLTVPKNFSSSILSLGTPSPVQANLGIRTDDAHSYLTGAVAQAVGDGMIAAFGKTVTANYISGIYSSVGTLGSSLTTAADGAGTLASGASSLSGGLATLASGASTAASGASTLASGVSKYTGGVDTLSSGLSTLNRNAAALPSLSQAITAASTQITALSAQLQAADPAEVSGISAELATASAKLAALTAQNAPLSGGVAGGISQSASGAAQIAANSAKLRSGSSAVASGVGQISGGATTASSGASELSTGVSKLATGLASGAGQLPAANGTSSAKVAKIAADPVGLTISRDHKIDTVGQVIATFLVPLGLWIGALATFLWLRPVSRRALASTATNGRLVASTLLKASAITGIQALLLVVLLHLGVGVPWSALPATLGFSILTALAFTAFHYLLTIGFGRVGLVVSLFLLAVQITSTAGLYPVQLLSLPFQWISPFLPLTYAVQGTQGIIAGGETGPIVVAALALLAFGVGSVLVGLVVIRWSRRRQTISLALPAMPRA